MSLKISPNSLSSLMVTQQQVLESAPVRNSMHSSVSTMRSAIGSVSSRSWIIVGLITTFLCAAALIFKIILERKNKRLPKDRTEKSKETLSPKPKETSQVKPYIGSDPGQLIDNTSAFIQQGYYETSTGQRFSLENGNALSARSQYFEYSDVKPINSELHTSIRVINQDCLEAAEELAQKNLKVLLVNFASPEYPGGGLEKIPGNQEEDLCYRSELLVFMKVQLDIVYNNLENHDPEHKLLYPLYSRKDPNIAGAVFTPDVKVFRAGKAQSYAFLENPFNIGILSSAAPHDLKTFEANMAHNRIDSSSPEYIRQKEELLAKVLEKAEKAIITQLTVAHQHGYEAIVLGAFGCGAFKIPPEKMAGLYKKILSTLFKGVFKEVVFAILDDNYKGIHNLRGNFKPFKECFAQ